MNFKELAAFLGIEEYPEKMEEVYEKMDKSEAETFNESALRTLEDEYSIFGEHYENVLAGAKALFEDKELCLWCLTMCNFVKVTTKEESAKAPFPVKEGIAADMMRVFPLLALVPNAVKLFSAHGFSHDEIKGIFNVFKISLRLSGIAVNKPAFTSTYYGWTRVYLYCEMFDCGSFNFQFKKFADPVVLLKNKKSGEFAALITEGRFHKAGRTLGDVGYAEEDGAFDAEFSETDEAYIGREAINNVASGEKKTYKKSEWDCVLKAGDDVIGLHIPRNVDFSDEAIEKSFTDGARMALERFPEYNPKFLVCSSWLLDPGLEDLLGSESRIVKFGKRFLRYPPKAGNGRGGYSFVFLGYEENENLPEDTSLRRKLKAHYLSGGNTYFYPGIITGFKI